MRPNTRQGTTRPRRSLALLLVLVALLPLGPPPPAAVAAAPLATEERAPGPNGATTFGGVSYMYARRGDGEVWVRKTDGLWYSGWSPLGGPTDATPAAASTARFVNVFRRGAGGGAAGGDGALWVNRSRDGVTYDGWRSLGGVAASAPAAVGLGDRVHVFTRDAQGMVWSRATDDGYTFSAPLLLGGPIAAAPVAVALTGVLTLYAQGGDGRRYALAARDGGRGDAWATWQPRGGPTPPLPVADNPAIPPLTLDVGVNFISAQNWQNYQLPAYSRLRPTLAKFSMFYDAYPASPAFGTREIDDAIARGARTVIFRTAETRIAPDEIERQLTVPLPGDGRSLLAYMRDQTAAGAGVDFWIEVGNEPDLAGLSPLVARYGLLAAIRDLAPKYPGLRWIASLPTKDGLKDSALPDYRGLAYLDLVLSDQGDGLGAIADRYDALGVHLYGADTLEQSYPALRTPTTPPDCGGSNGDALCPNVVLDYVLSRTDRPIFITEAGINSAMSWALKAKYYVDAMYRLPARVRGFALFTLSLDPEWYAGDGDRCPKPNGVGCTRYALDVDERGVVDASFAGSNGIGQCYQLPPPRTDESATPASAACWPPCLRASAPQPTNRPRSAVRRAPCAIDATRPSQAPSDDPGAARDRDAFLLGRRRRGGSTRRGGRAGWRGGQLSEAGG